MAAPSPSTGRPLLVLAIAGANLTLIQFASIKEYASLAGANEIVLLLVITAYFLGLSLASNQHNLLVSVLPNVLFAPRGTSNALVIVGGSLDSARYLAPIVAHLRVVELDETVVRITRELIQERRGGFPRSWDLTIDDGKHFLGSYDGPPFDVISIDIPLPTFVQTAMLHSERFFKLARTRSSRVWS